MNVWEFLDKHIEGVVFIGIALSWLFFMWLMSRE